MKKVKDRDRQREQLGQSMNSSDVPTLKETAAGKKRTYDASADSKVETNDGIDVTVDAGISVSTSVSKTGNTIVRRRARTPLLSSLRKMRCYVPPPRQSLKEGTTKRQRYTTIPFSRLHTFHMCRVQDSQLPRSTRQRYSLLAYIFHTRRPHHDNHYHKEQRSRPCAHSLLAYMLFQDDHLQTIHTTTTTAIRTLLHAYILHPYILHTYRHQDSRYCNEQRYDIITAVCMDFAVSNNVTF
jgi:hypothetical protein